VVCSTTVVWRSPHTSNLRLTTFSPRIQDYDPRIVLNIDDTLITSKIHSPITLGNLSSINLVSIFRCSSPTYNPLYKLLVSYPLVFLSNSLTPPRVCQTFTSSNFTPSTLTIPTPLFMRFP
jgi:hypothetical protein